MGTFENILGKGQNQEQAYQIVRQRANEAGWKIKIDNAGGIVIGFKDDLGIEDVFIKVCGSKDGNTVLEFSSMGIPFPDDISAAALFGLTLLERNGQMLMGHWGIEDINGNKFFTVFHSMIAEGMDVEEFKGAVKSVLNEKKRILLDAILNQKKEESDNEMNKLDFTFESSDHMRYENGIQVRGLTGGAKRAIKVEPNISGCEGYEIEAGDGYIVTIFNIDGNHPVWNNNVQMTPKPMRIISKANDKIVLRGYPTKAMAPFGWVYFNGADYGLTIFFEENEISKCVLHMYDRNADIEYLP